MKRALFLFLVLVMPVAGLVDVEPDETAKTLDPIGKTPGYRATAFATDGDYAIVFPEFSNLTFARSPAGGAEGWQTALITTGIQWGGPEKLVLRGVGDRWYLLAVDTTPGNLKWAIYNSSDDGVTWSVMRFESSALLDQTIVGDVADLHVYGTAPERIGVVVMTGGKDIKWYRTSDGGLTWDRNGTDLGDITSTNNMASIYLHVWDSAHLEIFTIEKRNCGSTDSTYVARLSSEDAGSFWSAKQDLIARNRDSGCAHMDSLRGHGNAGGPFGVMMNSPSGTDNMALFQFTEWGGSGGQSQAFEEVRVTRGAFQTVAGGWYFLPYQGLTEDLYYVAVDGTPAVVVNTTLPDDPGNVWMAHNDSMLVNDLNNAGFSNRYEIHQLGIDGGAPDTTGADQVIAVNQLVAMHVDPTGSVMITRHDGGHNVTTYDAGSLGIGGSVETHCTTDGKIAARHNMVMYWSCVPSGELEGAADKMRIRLPTLAAPQLDPPCDSFCLIDIDGDRLETDNTLGLEHNEMEAFPFDLSNVETYFCAPTCEYRVRLAFAVGMQSGEVCVITYQMNKGLVPPDKARGDCEALASSTGVADIATSLVGDDAYVCAGEGKSPTKIWRADFTSEELGTALGVSLVLVATYPVGYNRAEAVDCTGSLILVGNEGRIAVRDFLQGSVLWEREGPKVGVRAAAISADGKFVVYRDTNDGLVHVIDILNDTEVATLVPPAGAFRDVAIDSTAQTVWIATKDNIAKYTVWHLTTGVIVPPGQEVFEPGSGLFGGGSGVNQHGLAPIVGGKGAVANLINEMSKPARYITGVFIIAVMAGCAFALAGSSPMVVGGAAALGVIVNVASGFWEAWIIIAIGGLGTVLTFTHHLAKRVGG